MLEKKVEETTQYGNPMPYPVTSHTYENLSCYSVVYKNDGNRPPFFVISINYNIHSIFRGFFKVSGYFSYISKTYMKSTGIARHFLYFTRFNTYIKSTGITRIVIFRIHFNTHIMSTGLTRHFLILHIHFNTYIKSTGISRHFYYFM